MHAPYNDEDLTALATSDLGAVKALRLRSHLAGCVECRSEWDAVQSLWARAQAGRSMNPPAWLSSDLVGKVPTVTPQRRRSAPWRTLAALGAGAAAIISVILLSPGSPTQPTVAYADVQQAMLRVNIVHCTQDFTERFPNETLKSQGSIQAWARRSSPAIMTRVHYAKTTREDVKHISLMLTDTRGMIRYDPVNKTYYIDDARKEPDMAESAEEVERLIQGLTDPGNGSWPAPSGLARILSTTHGRSVVDGKAALTFVYRTSRYTKTVWADPQSLRVIRMEVVSTTPGKNISIWHDFEYNRSPAPGTFDWSPPLGAKIVTF